MYVLPGKFIRSVSKGLIKKAENEERSAELELYLIFRLNAD